ncbi:MAG: metal-dependent hydrolase [Acidobacteriota bacterium]|nr:metal-dependent hydrolase [Acidobacteriota bacterium]
MEPVTHFLTGAVLARSGFNRKAAYATVAMTLAAEMPDLDKLWSLGGPIAGFQHHRGFTHTLLGLPFDALLVLGTLWLYHRWRYKRTAATTLDGVSVETHRLRSEQRAPVRWGLLYGFILVALLSHLVLDWTNNYGVRPFFPINPRWYAGSFVFIFEPVLLLMLLVALVAPALFGLINAEVGARRPLYRGRGWAVAALLGMAALWGFRFYQRQQALALAATADLNGAPVLRSFASPYPINPFRWAVVLETPGYYQLATANTLDGTLSISPTDTIYRPPTTLATLAAKRSWLGEIFLDWSMFPVVAQDPHPPSPDDPKGLTPVTFTDLRFMYDVPFLPGRDTPPLQGMVLINADHRVARMELNHHVQH